MADAILRLAEAKGILPRYKDATGTVRETSRDTAQGILAALGLPVDNDAQAEAVLQDIHRTDDGWSLPDWQVTEADKPSKIKEITGQDWHLHLEDGQQIEGRGASLPGLPLGIHTLWISGRKLVLLAAPKRLPLPRPGWGLMVPLWGLRGRDAGGLGDFGDLVALVHATGASGPGFLGINPIHAGFPTVDSAHSPYQPSHRRRMNIFGIPVTGAASRGDLIDYPAEFALRRAALEAEFSAFEGDPRFEAFVDREGASLQTFARHQVLADHFGPYWSDWPAEAQSPAYDRPLDPDRLRFHAWAQWRADTTLAAAHQTARRAGLDHGLYLDLAVGTHPAGAETWEDAESFARGVSLGAPPDALGPEGQNWALAPLHPGALIQNNFQTLAETLRCQFRHCGILRIDHILGFERAFWVPDGGAPGGYVTMPRDAMLAVARIEAARAGGVIVGEDLGVVPDGLRAALDASGILGCRVAMFERDGAAFRRPERYPEATLASFSTHDLPTWDGWRTGQDLADWARLGVLSPNDLDRARQDRAADVAAFDQVAADGVHPFLAQTRARLIAVQAETLLGVRAQPNLPGTVTEYPNWRHRLPLAAHDLPQHSAYRAVCEQMAQAHRKNVRNVSN